MATNPSDDEAGATVKTLRQEIAALQHELRRVCDALERNPSHRLERRAGELRENVALCQRDLARALSRSPDRSGRE